MKTHPWERITATFFDADTNALLVGLSDGRIVMGRGLTDNAFLTGSRDVSAVATDYFGNPSHRGVEKMVFGLCDAILEVAASKRLLAWKSVSRPFSAERVQDIRATFLTPVLDAGRDFVRWDTVAWRQDVVSGGSVVVSVRCGADSGAVSAAPWVSWTTDDADASFSLDAFNPTGRMIQARVEMLSSSAASTSMGSLSLGYHKLRAAYFFTTKFSLEKGTDARRGLLTCGMTKPQNSEISFGVSKSNSGDWRDYVEVPVGQAFDVPSPGVDSVKVGIRLVPYDAVAVPEVDEFAVMIGGEKDNLLNKT